MKLKHIANCRIRLGKVYEVCQREVMKHGCSFYVCPDDDFRKAFIFRPFGLPASFEASQDLRRLESLVGRCERRVLEID